REALRTRPRTLARSNTKGATSGETPRRAGAVGWYRRRFRSVGEERVPMRLRAAPRLGATRADRGRERHPEGARAVGGEVRMAGRVGGARWVVLAACAAMLAVPFAPPAGGSRARSSVDGPVWARNAADWNRTSSPTIADVDGDGVADVVYGS